jgi:hypothetical protein
VALKGETTRHKAPDNVTGFERGKTSDNVTGLGRGNRALEGHDDDGGATRTMKRESILWTPLVWRSVHPRRHVNRGERPHERAARNVKDAEKKQKVHGHWRSPLVMRQRVLTGKISAVN